MSDEPVYRPGWRKSKMHECRSWGCCAQGKLVLTAEERDAIFAYIDQLEARIKLVYSGGSIGTPAGGGGGGAIKWFVPTGGGAGGGGSKT